jgi:acyl-CoA synthetase (AMP-forming)/AMP-acid ligase II
VKRLAVGMDFLSPSLAQRLKAKFPNLTSAVNGYGLVETTNVFMICRALTEEALALPTTRMQLVENIDNAIEVRDQEGNAVPVGSEGELYIKGSNVIPGYLGNPEATQQSFSDGWFRTGDIVRNEGNNTITLLGRKKYLIKRGGKSVSPIVVQNHIVKLAGVNAAAVVGVPHQLYGEMVWAFVVVDKDSDVQLRDVMKHCRAELANYMVPDQVIFIDEIPKNPGVGKVNFEKLQAMAAQELATMQGGNNGEQY